MATGKRKMKIGILTQPLTTNYGGILQNWALQQVLKDIGHEPEMIFRHLDVCEGMTFHSVSKNIKKTFKGVLKKCLNRRSDGEIVNPFKPHNYYTERPFDNGFKSQINKTKAAFTNSALKRLIRRGNYDAFIVGSDQVWRQLYSPDILTYFLNFLPESDKRPRIAYAASFGVNHDYIDQRLIPECKALLKRFVAVSVREQSGVEVLKRDFDIKGIRVLDPTLLLQRERYESNASSENSFITTYVLDDENKHDSILSSVKTHIGVAEVKEMSVCPFWEDPSGFPSVKDWLSNIANAEFVVTDSFHGCVFSILFHRPFIAIGNKDRGLDRFTSLLSMFGLMSRLVLTEEEFHEKKDSLLQAIDYTEVDKILEMEREKSLDFLRNALS